jgi:poly(hydroxyalkanoate) granule-associated protein
MTEQERAEKTEAEEEVFPVAEAMRKAFLAGIGALDLARERAEEMMGRLAERGEKVREERRAYWEKKWSRRQARLDKMQAKMQKRMGRLMNLLNVPTRGDIEALNEKVEELSRKIDALQKAPPTA